MQCVKGFKEWRPIGFVNLKVPITAAQPLCSTVLNRLSCCVWLGAGATMFQEEGIKAMQHAHVCHANQHIYVMEVVDYLDASLQLIIIIVVVVIIIIIFMINDQHNKYDLCWQHHSVSKNCGW